MVANPFEWQGIHRRTVNHLAHPSNEMLFEQQFRGSFVGILRWHQLDELWQTLQSQTDKSWYIYTVGEDPPNTPLTAESLKPTIAQLDQTLRDLHREDYCGIVYSDSLTDPQFVKIFHPKKLGSVCGFSDQPPLPQWILSTIPPTDLARQRANQGKHKRWWGRLFS